MMGENRARAIAEVEIRRERAAIEADDVFDVGRELREETRKHIEDDRQFLQSGDYLENFVDEKRWVLHHLCPRYDLCGPSREVMAYGGPASKVLDNTRFTRLEFKNGDVEELWDDRFSGRERSARKWVGFSTFWAEGFAPNAPPKIRSPGTPRTRVMGSGRDYEQDMPRIERPYQGSSKPNSISSAKWERLSVKGRRDYIAYDKLRIREKAEGERKDIENRAEETGETWKSAGKSLWIARQSHAERPEGVPEHFRVWARYDTNARTMRASRAGGPPMSQVLHRVTRSADSREVIASEVIPHGIEEEEPGTIRRPLVRPQDIITELWYEPEEETQENEGQAQSSASGLRTGGPDRREKPVRPDARTTRLSCLQRSRKRSTPLWLKT